MPVSINEVLLAGAITSSPRCRQTPTGKNVCQFVMAIPSVGNSVTFVDVTAWEELADTAKEFVSGDEAIVKGRLVSETYATRDGRKVFKLSVTANSVVPTGEAPSITPEEAA